MFYNQNMKDAFETILSDDECWQAVTNRDNRYDGRFVTGVVSTGIYCRPSCRSRLPLRSNVRFYQTPRQAEDAGYRPCHRCRPDQPDLPVWSDEAQQKIVKQVCDWIDKTEEERLTLSELGKRVHMSPYHLQRVFKHWMGLTPHQYTLARRQERLKEALKEMDTVTGALYSAGYGTSSSVYAKSGQILGMTPGEYLRGGQNQVITVTWVPCRLGFLLVASTERGLCAVMLGNNPEELNAELAKEFPAATLTIHPQAQQNYVQPLLDFIEGIVTILDLPLDLQGTLFQRKVWQALQEIPYGSQRTYQQVAASIGSPRAVRAVASACAANRTALVIPCHRVIRTDGGMGGYRWGIERKIALLRGEEGQKKA